MNLGNAFKADFRSLKVFVQLGPEGWAVLVYDLDERKAVYSSRVSDPEEGKALAVEMALRVLDLTADDAVRAREGIHWESY